MNILSLIQSQLSPQAVSQISNTVGESPENTQSALSAAVPAVMGSLLGKANASPDGATQIFNLLKQGQQGQGGWMDSIGSLLSGSGSGQAPSGAGSLLNSLLGSKLGGVTEFIASHCGIKGSSAMSILGMAAPLVMGTLGKQVSSQGLGSAGLGQLLNSQADHLKDALPAGLANTLGIGSLLSGSHDTTRMATESASQPRQTYTTPSAVPAGAAASRGSPLRWAVPLVVAAAVALWALSHKSEKTPAVGGTEDYTQTQIGRGINTPDLSSLNLTPGSLGDRVAKAISKGDFSQKFDLQNLNFDNTGRLTDSADTQLKQFASIMKVVPSLKASITGYGATPDEGKTKATAIKSALVSDGITEDRILARGDTGNSAPSLRVMR